MMNTNDNQKWLFYLVFTTELDSLYLKLASKFAEQGISIVPVNITQFLELYKNRSQINLLICTDTLLKQKRLEQVFDRYLKFVINNQRLRVFHLSSFGPSMSVSSQNKEFYHHFKLPYSRELLVSEVNNKLEQYDNVKNRWPGARMRKVPQNLF